MTDTTKETNSFKIKIPADHFAIFFGVATASWSQMVMVRQAGKVSVLEAVNGGLFRFTDGSGATEEGPDVFTIKPSDTEQEIGISFGAVSEDQLVGVNSKVRLTKTEVSKMNTYYTFNAEDGEDNDYQDTNFTIAVFPSKK